MLIFQMLEGMRNVTIDELRHALGETERWFS